MVKYARLWTLNADCQKCRCLSVRCLLPGVKPKTQVMKISWFSYNVAFAGLILGFSYKKFISSFNDW